MELYKAHRPTTFKEIVGQDDAKKFVWKAWKDKSLPQVLLFRGPSGCGKTTLARIIAMKLECHALDLVEMNSSSFRGIDTVRDLEKTSRLSAWHGSCRVYILDEVHKWTSDAQHASLKLLEDTPANVYFLLCTTNPEKLIAPLRNRCTEVVLGSLSSEALETLLAKVAKDEGIKVAEFTNSIVDAAEGSARQLLVILDRVRHLPVEDWEESISRGASDAAPEIIELCRLLMEEGARWPSVAKVLKGLTVEPESVRRAVLGYASACLLASKNGDGRAYAVLQAFADPFYDTGKPGLVGSCREVVFPAGE